MLELSPFRLSMFRQCRRKYKFHYIDGLYKEYGRPRPYFTMGENVHWVLSTFFKSATPPEKRTLAHLEALLRQRWRINRKGFAGDDEEREWGQKALRQLKGFFAVQDIHAVPRMTEAVHKVPLAPNLRLMGKIDRVDEVEDGWVITDYKTGKRPMQTDLLQLRVYSLILTRKFKQPIAAARYLYLESGGVSQIGPKDMMLDETEEELIVAAEEIEAEQEYLPLPNRLCPHCDFADLCPEGIAYGGPSADTEQFELD